MLLIPEAADAIEKEIQKLSRDEEDGLLIDADIFIEGERGDRFATADVVRGEFLLVVNIPP